MRRLICRFRGHRWGEWQRWKVRAGVRLVWVNGKPDPPETNGTADYRWCRRCHASDMRHVSVSLAAGWYRTFVP